MNNVTEELVELVEDLHGLTIKLAEERDVATKARDASDKKASDLAIELEKVAGQVKAAAGRAIPQGKIDQVVQRLESHGLLQEDARSKMAAALQNPEACLDTVFELAGMLRPMQGAGMPVNLPNLLPGEVKSASHDSEAAELAAERAELKEMMTTGAL